MPLKKIDIALTYLQMHPVEAAMVLESQPAQDVAAFLNNVPYKQSATVLKHMLPQFTARLCNHLRPKIAAGFLSEMDVSLVAGILRHLEPDLIEAILDRLPEGTKVACNILLNYPEATVGAWMNAKIFVLPVDCSVEDALARLSAENDFNNMGIAFVADRDRKLQGHVNIPGLLRAAPSMLISSVMQTNSDTILGRTSLASAAKNPLWKRAESAAVINKDQQIIGVIRHLEIRVGLESLAKHIQKPTEDDTITEFCKVYGSSLLAMLNTVSGVSETRQSTQDTTQ